MKILPFEPNVVCKRKVEQKVSNILSELFRKDETGEKFYYKFFNS